MQLIRRTGLLLVSCNVRVIAQALNSPTEENLRRVSKMLTALQERDQIDGHGSELLMLVESALENRGSLARWRMDS